MQDIKTRHTLMEKKANVFLKETLDWLNLSGKILLPAEGEGRNAVYAAKKGLEVYAFDISAERKIKAEQLAKTEKVTIHYEVENLYTLSLLKQKYDVVALIYAHFPSSISAKYHQTVAELIKPSGILILEGFSKNHLELQRKNPTVGGPKNIDMLFSKAQLQKDFSTLEVLELEEVEIVLSEGKFHNGRGKVIRFIGKKIVKQSIDFHK